MQAISARPPLKKLSNIKKLKHEIERKNSKRTKKEILTRIHKADVLMYSLRRHHHQ
jgi:hypothetical protein